MTIASELTKLNTNLTNSYTAVSGKGGTLPQAQNFDNLATAISSIPSGGTSSKYGASIDSFLGDVDANGKLQIPADTDSDIVFTGVKDIANYGLSYKFYNNFKLKHRVSFPDLITISGSYACTYMFYNGGVLFSGIPSVAFPVLITISGSSACAYMFSGCSYIESVDLSSLKTISGSSACTYMFSGCKKLSTISFTMLSTISGSYACTDMFSGCKKLTDVYFPALTTSSFGSYTDQFSSMMSLTSNKVTHTLHFPSNLESTISGLSGYPLFGGLSGYVVLSFDLPATS